MITFSDLRVDMWGRSWFTATDTETGRSHDFQTSDLAFDKDKASVIRLGLPPLPPAWDSEAELAKLQAEYAYPNHFRKAP